MEEKIRVTKVNMWDTGNRKWKNLLDQMCVCFREQNNEFLVPLKQGFVLFISTNRDRLCGLVVRVLGYRSGGPGSIPSTTRNRKAVGLERGPLSIVSTTEELLDRKVAAPVYKTENTAVGICHADHLAPSILKSWQSLRRQAAVARSV
jgi:hypothetical protein